MSSCVNLLLSSKDASYPLPFGKGFFFILGFFTLFNWT
ncbi:hypothetical protein HMPREF1517_1923 [Streptococcus sp. ACS2]|nr:hypothetical protein HMPREF1517_1923 [Streptococcus sp. ACS2]